MKQYALITIFTTEAKAIEYKRRLHEHGFDFAIVIINDESDSGESEKN